jgi:AcrR family transcriptional regulator
MRRLFLPLSSFLQDGHAGFATRRVARRVGIALANVQHYFRTKEELLHTALQAYMRQRVNDYTAIASLGVGAARHRTGRSHFLPHQRNRSTEVPV